MNEDEKLHAVFVDRDIWDQPLTLATLARFHREVFVPDLRRAFGRLDRMDARFDAIDGHFDAIGQRFERLETEYRMIVARVRRLEERMDLERGDEHSDPS